MIFDLETTGIPKQRTENFADMDAFSTSRIVSIAWCVVTMEGDRHIPDARTFHVIERVVLPEGFTIPEEATKIHGISQDDALQTGHTIKTVLEEFYTAARECTRLVAHNISFDVPILLHELYRQQMYEELLDLRSKMRYCTMLKAKEMLQLPKCPKLSELYTLLTGSTHTTAHTASGDVHVCAHCYLTLDSLQRAARIVVLP
jgi:DNA polymerase-3 subunit epsilon